MPQGMQYLQGNIIIYKIFMSKLILWKVGQFIYLFIYYLFTAVVGILASCQPDSSVGKGIFRGHWYYKNLSPDFLEIVSIYLYNEWFYGWNCFYKNLNFICIELFF